MTSSNQKPRGAIITILIYLIIGLVLYYFIPNLSNKWGENLKYYSTIYPKVLFFKQTPLDATKISYDIDKYLNQKNISQIQKQRIKDQIYLLRDRAITSLRVARDFYCWMLIIIIILCISTIVSAMFAYEIIKKGWDNIDNSTKLLFQISLTLSLTTASFNSVFEPGKNSVNYFSLYRNYIAIEEYIFTALTIKYLPNNPQNTKMEIKQVTYPDNLIITVDKLLEFHSIYMKFDPQSLPKLDEVLKSIQIDNK